MSDQSFGAPSFRSRMAVLLFFPLYVSGLSSMVSFTTGQSPLVAVSVVLIWIACLMAVLGAFAVRYYLHGQRSIRFRLSTVFLLTAMVGIYMAGYRWMAVSMHPEESESFAPLIGFVLFCLVNTALLVVCLEAFVWAALRCWIWVSTFRRRHIAVDESDADHQMHLDP